MIHEPACGAMRLLCCEVAKLNDPAGSRLDDHPQHSLNDTVNHPRDHLITLYCDVQWKVKGGIKVTIPACLLVEQYETAERWAAESWLINDPPGGCYLDDPPYHLLNATMNQPLNSHLIT